LRKLLFIAVLVPILGGMGWWYFREQALPDYGPAYREYAYVSNGKGPDNDRWLASEEILEAATAGSASRVPRIEVLAMAPQDVDAVGWLAQDQ